MKDLAFPRITGASSLISLVLVSFLFGFSSYGGFHPYRMTDQAFENEPRQPTLNLENQILLARDHLKLPHLGWSDLNLLSDLAEVKTTKLFGDRPSGFSTSISRARVKALLFSQLLKVALLGQGHKSEWLFEEKITSTVSSSDANRLATIDPWTSQNWFGTIKVIDRSHFIWIPESKLEEFPLLKDLVNTLSLAFQIEPQLKLFSEFSLPLFQHTHKGQSLIATLAMEDLFYRVMQFDFFRRGVKDDFSNHDLEPSNGTDNYRDLLVEKMKATNLKTRPEYLRSEMMATLPTVAFLSPNFFNEIKIWIDSLPEGFTFQREGLGLENYKSGFSERNQLESQNVFSLARKKNELLRKNRFLDYSLVHDFTSSQSRNACQLRLVR